MRRLRRRRRAAARPARDRRALAAAAFVVAGEIELLVAGPALGPLLGALVAGRLRRARAGAARAPVAAGRDVRAAGRSMNLFLSRPSSRSVPLVGVLLIPLRDRRATPTAARARRRAVRARRRDAAVVLTLDDQVVHATSSSPPRFALVAWLAGRGSCARAAADRGAARGRVRAAGGSTRRGRAARPPTSGAGSRARCTTWSRTRSRSWSCRPAARGGSSSATRSAPSRPPRRSSDTGRAALIEMRRLLGVLHHGEDEAGRAPQPTLRELDALVERARAAGLPVDAARSRATPRAAARRPGPRRLPRRPGGADERDQARRRARRPRSTVRWQRRRAGARGRRHAAAAVAERPNGARPRARRACASACALYGGELRTGQRPAAARGPRAVPAERSAARGCEPHDLIRILIADDQALVRAGFRMILDAEEDLDVVGEAADGAEAVDAGAAAGARRRADGHPHARARRHRGDAPGASAPAATRRSRVLMLTTFDLNEYVYEALRAGASGFLLKDVPPEQLAAGIRVVAQGEALLAPSITTPADPGVRRAPRRRPRRRRTGSTS